MVRPPLDGHRPRNTALVDPWSFTHIAWGILLVFFLPPFVALAILVLWEPFEVLVLSSILAKRGLSFGHESLRNVLLDIVFDVVGVALGTFVVRPAVLGFF